MRETDNSKNIIPGQDYDSEIDEGTRYDESPPFIWHKRDRNYDKPITEAEQFED